MSPEPEFEYDHDLPDPISGVYAPHPTDPDRLILVPDPRDVAPAEAEPPAPESGVIVIPIPLRPDSTTQPSEPSPQWVPGPLLPPPVEEPVASDANPPVCRGDAPRSSSTDDEPIPETLRSPTFGPRPTQGDKPPANDTAKPPGEPPPSKPPSTPPADHHSLGDDLLLLAGGTAVVAGGLKVFGGAVTAFEAGGGAEVEALGGPLGWALGAAAVGLGVGALGAAKYLDEREALKHAADSPGHSGDAPAHAEEHVGGHPDG
jgi:hypothetical protein